MSYDPIMSRIRDALNARKYRSYSEALEAYRKNKSNAITLEGGFLLKYHLQLRGFVVQTPEFPRREFPVCPVYGCSGYAAGGHSCRHAMEFVKSLTEPVVTVKKVVQVISKAKQTKDAFNHLLASLGREVDVNYCGPHSVSKKEWISMLRFAVSKGKIEHKYNGGAVTFVFTKTGQLSYKNSTTYKWLHKCPLPNCLKVAPYGSRKAKGRLTTSAASLCAEHQDRLDDLIELVRLVNQK